MKTNKKDLLLERINTCKRMIELQTTVEPRKRAAYVNEWEQVIEELLNKYNGDTNE